MTPSEARERLKRISEELDAGEFPEKILVRDLLAWFDAQRRGFWIVNTIRGALKKNNLATKPDFEGAFIESLTFAGFRSR